MLIVTKYHIINSERMNDIHPILGVSTIAAYKVSMIECEDLALTVEEFEEAKEQVRSSAILEDLEFKSV